MTENAKKLVAALRSGEYSRSMGHLRDVSGYCCLGVACEIYRQETGEGKWRPGADGIFVFEIGGMPEEFHLLPLVRDWLGFRTTAGEYDGKHSLADENDRGTSFSEIADIIETHDDLFMPGGLEESI